jgi:hypothetical protein
VLAHAVHLADAGAAVEQLLVDALLVGQRQAFGRQHQQRRAAARDQAQHQVVGREALREREDALGGLLPGRVGHGVRGLDDLDALRHALGARRNVLVACDDQPRQRRVGRPQASSACTIEPPALPAPSTSVRPFLGGGFGRWAPSVDSGSARSTATR